MIYLTMMGVAQPVVVTVIVVLLQHVYSLAQMAIVMQAKVTHTQITIALPIAATTTLD